MASDDADRVLRQLRTVARWWAGDARIEQGRVQRDGDRYAQAARASRHQADDWTALGDLLAAHIHPHQNLSLPRLVQAAERLADRLYPDWRKVTAEEVGGDGRTPCPEGFHWIGQALTACDQCGLPAWDHAGMAKLGRPLASPSDKPEWVLDSWKPGEREAIRRRWDPSYRGEREGEHG